jgi:hypothetical protein
LRISATPTCRPDECGEVEPPASDELEGLGEPDELQAASPAAVQNVISAVAAALPRRRGRGPVEAARFVELFMM